MAGAKLAEDRVPTLVADMDGLISPTPRHPARELQARGHQVSDRTVARLLMKMDYSVQANRKTLEGKQHPDRDEQFTYPAHSAE